MFNNTTGWQNRGRGGYRPPFTRGGFSPRYDRFAGTKPQTPRSPSPPLGSVVRCLKADEILNHKAGNGVDRDARITDCKYVASFNWLDGEKPTILVPGITISATERMPPAWTPLVEPRKLSPDQGEYFRDPNAARFPTYPLEPAVRTLLLEDKELDTQSIDLFACTSTLGSLLRFVRRVDKQCRFWVEVVGNTVFFIRHENSPKELIPDVKGYGHTFPEAYTSWDPAVKASASHQRLLRYDFAGLDCIVRFECDGYLRERVPMAATAITTTAAKSWQTQDVGTLDDVLSTLKVRSILNGGSIPSDKLEIGIAGQKVPQDAVFDLKTRWAGRKNINVLEDELPRYWVAQIPNFILALHSNGVFNDVKVQRIPTNVDEWEAENQKDLKALTFLLHTIIDEAKKRKDGKLEVRVKNLDELELRMHDSNEHNVLPPELNVRWRSGKETTRVKLEEAKSADNHSEDGDQAPSLSSDDGDTEDYTACSAECDYCGHCSY